MIAGRAALLALLVAATAERSGGATSDASCWASAGLLTAIAAASIATRSIVISS